MSNTSTSRAPSEESRQTSTRRSVSASKEPRRKPLTDDQIDHLIARLIGDDEDRSEALMLLMDELCTVNADTAREIARLATRTAFTKLDEAMDAQIQLLRTEL